MARLSRLLALPLILLALASPAQASTPAPELNGVATEIAGQAIEVRCWADDNDDPDFDAYSWGYVRLMEPIIYMSPLACEGARALANGTMAPLWQLALGALTLTHESYHLKDGLPWARRASEAQTECRAIKRVPEVLHELTRSDSLSSYVLPWAIALHYKVSLLEDWGGKLAYNYPSCLVPVISSFWAP